MSTVGADLGRYVATLRRRWVLAVAIVAVAAAAGYVVARLSPTSYAATAKVLLDQDRHVDELLGTTGYAPDPERELNTGVLLITLQPIAADVRRSLGLRESSAALAARVSAGTDRNSAIVSITARDADPRQAARIANAFAAGYRRYRGATIRESIDEALASARARRSALVAESERRALDDQVRRLQASAAFDTGGVKIVHHATAAAASVTPRPLVSGFVAGILGVVLAAVAVVVLTRTDTRVRDERELEQAVGRPVLGLVRDPRSARDALLLTATAFRRPVVLVTSPGPGEGADDVMLGLARAIALSGRTAIAIDADLHVSSSGLADRIDDELMPLVVDEGGGGSAWALLAGAVPLSRMIGMVEEARAKADVVLVCDHRACVALTGVAAEVLLVARLDVTRVDELRRTVRSMTVAGVEPVGVVATTTPPRPSLRARAARLLPRSAWSRQSAPRPETAPEVTAG